MTVPRTGDNFYGAKLVVENVDHLVRCWRCNRLLAEYATRPWKLICTRCKAVNQRVD